MVSSAADAPSSFASSLKERDMGRSDDVLFFRDVDEAINCSHQAVGMSSLLERKRLVEAGERRLIPRVSCCALRLLGCED